MKNVSKKFFVCTIIVLITFLCFSKFAIYVFDKQEKKETKVVENMLNAYKNNIILNLTEKFNYSKDLTSVLVSNNYSIDKLKPIADEILKNNSCIYISVVEKYNVAAFFSNSVKKDIINTPIQELNYSYSLANSIKGLVVEGPSKDQFSNGDVFLITNPIYKNGEYWGEITVALDAKKVVESFNLNKLKESGFEYELWRVHLDNGSKSTIEISTKDFNFSKSHEIKFKLPTVWTLSIVYKNGWNNKNIDFIVFVTLLIISILIGVMTFIYIEKKSISKELNQQSLKNLETGILNREGFLIKLQEHLNRKNNEIVLLYICITNYSKFAPVMSFEKRQDYLTHIVKNLDNYIKSSHFIARISEEGFVLALEENCDKNELLNIEKGISLELLRKIKVENKQVFLTIGYGSSRCVDDRKDAESLLLSAIEDYERRFPAMSPIHDFTKKCEDMLDEKKQIVFGEYPDLEINKLSKVIYKYYKKVQRIMYKDYNIDIGNRRGYMRDVEVLIDYNSERMLYLFLIDICKFGKFNELFSIEIGDVILKEVSNKLKTIFSNYLYRINGDVFLGISIDKESYLDTLHKVNEVFNSSLSVEDVLFDVKCNIGICQYPYHGENPYDLLEKVQIALEYAKKDVKSNVKVYDKELTEEIYHENNIIKDLKKGLEEQTLEVWYQPIFNVSKNCYIKAEALIRLRNKEGGYYSAYEVITYAEKHGLIKDVGLYVLKKACDVTTKIKDKNIDFEQMQLNLSVQQIVHKQCANDILSCIENCGLDKKYICVEVTETVLMETFEIVNVTLDKLKKEGISIALDEFGSGFSSINYLANLPIENLKIDKELVEQITYSKKQFELLKTIVQIAKINGMDIVAEGVETKETLDLVVTSGVNLIQGHYFSEPLSEDKFIELMIEE
ncbi:TPA: EAL domain-containing protein [Clostridioides difficile]